MGLLLRVTTTLLLIVLSVEWVMWSWQRPTFVLSVMLCGVAIAIGSLLCLYPMVAMPNKGA